MSNIQILNISLAAGDTASPWYRLFSKDASYRRAVHGILTSGDTIGLEFTNEELTTDRTAMTSTASTTNVAVSPIQSGTNFEFAYDGNFKWVRAVKTGSNGTAKVTIEA